MRLTLARSMAHTLSCNTPVKKSTGRFGALQVGKVLSSGEANREKRDWKGLWESLLLTRSLSFFFPDMMANTNECILMLVMFFLGSWLQPVA